VDGLVTQGIVAVIPARGGSTRLPTKNVLDVAGRPLVAWTIDAAVQSGVFDRVLVSTDDPAIAEVAEFYGAPTPFLRDRAFDDHAPVVRATLTALAQLEALGERYDTVVQLLPTCPLRHAEHVRVAVTYFVQGTHRFQISCGRLVGVNGWWAATLDRDLRPTPLFHDAMTQRSQDLAELYYPTGAIWVANVSALEAAGSFYGPGHIYLPLSWPASVDIDNAEDLDLARTLLSSPRPAPDN
jgi:CMP-N-acetylneuraminic acid synthetase